MKIYNTLTRNVEQFTPNEDNVVRMYTCGPTVYHYAHIGNLRTYIFEDILEKGLEYLNYEVLRVMNVTDVGHLENDSDDGEDKMQKGAEREHKSVYEIADFYERAFFQECEKLNIRKPKVVERATKHIDTYIEMIKVLLDKGFAYISNGNVYFDVSKANNYYQLSGKNQDELFVGVRDTVEEDKSKRNPQDFGLWFTVSKFSNQEMKWDSPWGVGYPGWHIECSGISYKFLGEYLDIHCGGVDNIFPHHTNEIAQSEGFLGHKWCNYWVHGEHLNDSTGKMSKSKGEFLTISLLESKGYNPLAYRLLCLQSHYRKILVFSYESLDAAQKTYNKLRNKIKKLDRTPDLHESKIDYYKQKFSDAISNDLNTSSMLTVLYDVLKDDELSDFTKLYLIEDFDKVLGLDLIANDDENIISDETESMILKKIEERNEAKKNKDFAKADKIRDELFDQGIKLIDSRDGTTYEIIEG